MHQKTHSNLWQLRPLIWANNKCTGTHCSQRTSKGTRDQHDLQYLSGGYPNRNSLISLIPIHFHRTQRLEQMLLTLASGSATESLHLIQDLLISQLRLTGTCGYLSDGFGYTNTSHAFQTTSVRLATFITCRSQTDSCSIRTSTKISMR